MKRAFDVCTARPWAMHHMTVPYFLREGRDTRGFGDATIDVVSYITSASLLLSGTILNGLGAAVPPTKAPQLRRRQ
jgi:hypothetical protein